MKYRCSARFGALFGCLPLLLALIACGSLVMQNPPPALLDLKSAEVIGTRVFLVVFENQKYDVIVGRPPAPYLNSLIAQGGLATQFYANVHPSEPNYFMLTSGQTLALSQFPTGIIDVNNLARLFGQNGVSWRAYMESLPRVGYTGDLAYPYAKAHNPFAYYSDIHLLPQQADNMVPFTQFASDLANHTLPSFSYIVPNQLNNMHDCPAGTTCTNGDKILRGDQWLQNNVGPLLNSPEFQKDGILIITWDESWDTDSTNGGGHIPVIIVGPGVKAAFQSTRLYKHESVLRLIEERLIVPVTLGNSTAAPSMDEFLVGH